MSAIFTNQFSLDLAVLESRSNSRVKRTGALVGNFETNPQELQDLFLFCRRGLNFSYPQEVLFITQRIISCHIDILKGIAKALAVEILRMNTPRSTKTAF